jgi:hypothetical protein
MSQRGALHRLGGFILLAAPTAVIARSAQT